MQGDTVKNKFFTAQFVLTPKFAGTGSVEEYYGRIPYFNC